MTMTRQQAIDFLKNNPYKFAHMLGFTKLRPIHNKWIRDMLCGKEDKTLQASRGTYKTTSVSIALALIIILLPNYRTMFMRKTDIDIKEVIKQVRKILSDAHTQYFVQIIYGVQLKLLVQSATEISTNLTTDIKGTSQLIGMGIGSSLTGKHFDRVFTDDIVNINDRISKAERERTKIIYQELQNIKNRGGRIYNTGTPWHADDCFSIMPDPEKFDCYNPEIQEIISEKELAEIKSKMLPSLFAANYELRHIASEDVIFSDPHTGYDPSVLQQATHCHIDAAYGGEDWTAFTIAKKTEGKLYVLGKTWHKHVDDCLDDIIRLRKEFNAGKIWCESNADKGYLQKELKRLDERATTYHEGMNKFVKITTYLKGAWNDIIFVDGTDKEYIQQILDFNENAEHDDCPDSLATVARLMYSKNGNQEYVSVLY